MVFSRWLPTFLNSRLTIPPDILLRYFRVKLLSSTLASFSSISQRYFWSKRWIWSFWRTVTIIWRLLSSVLNYWLIFFWCISYINNRLTLHIFFFNKTWPLLNMIRTRRTIFLIQWRIYVSFMVFSLFRRS